MTQLNKKVEPRFTYVHGSTYSQYSKSLAIALYLFNKSTKTNSHLQMTKFQLLYDFELKSSAIHPLSLFTDLNILGRVAYRNQQIEYKHL